MRRRRRVEERKGGSGEAKGGPQEARRGRREETQGAEESGEGEKESGEEREGEQSHAGLKERLRKLEKQKEMLLASFRKA